MARSWRRHRTQRVTRKAITASEADHLRRQAPFELAEETNDARRSANAGSDFGKELGGSARAKREQMLDTALQTKGMEVDHGGDLSARRSCTCEKKRVFARCHHTNQ